MSVFLEIPSSAWIAENDHAFAVRDAYPVTEGHTLVITKEVVPTWFDASPEQRQALMDLVDVVRDQLKTDYGAFDFNIGINVGPAAGQTVDHLHVHVIPLYREMSAILEAAYEMSSLPRATTSPLTRNSSLRKTDSSESRSSLTSTILRSTKST